MAFDGSGTFNRVYSWVTDRNNGIKILAERMDTETDGIATGLSTTITRDGQSTATARIPFAQGISVTLGTVTAPSISPTGDSNTGIWSSAADILSFSAGGSKITEITTAGIAITGTLAASSDVAINTNKFTVAASTGNTLVAGTLNVTGAATFSSAVTYGGVTLTNNVTGTGKMVLDTTPTLVTPIIGVATATTVNKLTITAPASGSTLTIADGKTLTVSNILTFTGTDSSSVAFGAGGTATYLAGNQTLTGGFNATSFSAGTKSSGTYTPDPLSGNHQHATNGGAHTLAPPGSTCSMVIEYTNNGSAGAITTSGFTRVTGDAFTTTNGHIFLCYVARSNGGSSHLHVQAMQ